MAKRVYLHIGWEKTGSSSIQSFCGRNQDWLRERGIRYPLMGPIPQHVGLFRDIESRSPARIQRSVSAVRDVIAASETQNIVFSHESLHSCPPAVFGHIFRGCDVRVLAYVRKPDEAAISFFVTMIRFGQLSAGDLYRAMRHFAATRLGEFDYHWSLAGFASEFGRENLSVRHYDRTAMVGGQTVTDFLSCLGLDDLSGAKWVDARSNPSIDADQFAFALLFSRLLAADIPGSLVCQLTHMLCNELSRRCDPDSSRPVGRFVPDSIRRRLLEWFEPSLPPLYDQYFAGRAIFGESAGDVPRPERYGSIPPDRMSEFRAAARAVDSIPAGVLERFELVLDSGEPGRPAHLSEWVSGRPG